PTTITANGSGTWSYTPSTALGEGSHSFTAIATDLAGNVSAASSAFVLNVDTLKPGVPSISAADDILPVMGPVTNGGYTNDAIPVLSGTAEAGSTVSLYDNASLVTTVTANATTGAWSYTPSALSDGSTHSFTVTATDAAGNVSDASSAYVLNIDTTKPNAPVISVSDNVNPVPGNVPNNGYTNDTTPTLSGTVEAYSTVIIKEGATQLTSITTDGTGSWSYTPSSLADGSTHNYTVTATDRAGNISDPSTHRVYIDTTTPSASITGASDNTGAIQGSLANGAHTDDTTPTLSGTTEAGSTISIYDNGTLFNTFWTGGGAWNYT